MVANLHFQLTMNRPISYIKILTCLRGGGGGEWGKKGGLFVPRRDFLCFIPLNIGAKLEFQYLEISSFAIQMVSLNSQVPGFKRLSESELIGYAENHVTDYEVKR